VHPVRAVILQCAPAAPHQPRDMSLQQQQQQE
jgi:hypothetical protein